MQMYYLSTWRFEDLGREREVLFIVNLYFSGYRMRMDLLQRAAERELHEKDTEEATRATLLYGSRSLIHTD